MSSEEHGSPWMEWYMRALEVDSSGSNTLNLSSSEDYPRLKRFNDFIIKECFFVSMYEDGRGWAHARNVVGKKKRETL
jgi:hypothetical protein